MTYGDRQQPDEYDSQRERDRDQYAVGYRSGWETQQQPVVGQPGQSAFSQSAYGTAEQPPFESRQYDYGQRQAEYEPPLDHGRHQAVYESPLDYGRQVPDDGQQPASDQQAGQWPVQAAYQQSSDYGQPQPTFSQPATTGQWPAPPTSTEQWPTQQSTQQWPAQPTSGQPHEVWQQEPVERAQPHSPAQPSYHQPTYQQTGELPAAYPQPAQVEPQPQSWGSQQPGYQQDPQSQPHDEPTGQLPQLSAWRSDQSAQPSHSSQPQWQQTQQQGRHEQPGQGHQFGQAGEALSQHQWQPSQAGEGTSQWAQPGYPAQEGAASQQWQQQQPEWQSGQQAWQAQQAGYGQPMNQGPAGQEGQWQAQETGRAAQPTQQEFWQGQQQSPGQPSVGQPNPGQPGGYQQPQQPWQTQQAGQGPIPGSPQLLQPPTSGQPQQGQWQQPVQPAPQPPANKSRRGLWIGLAAGAVVLVLLAGCGVAFALLKSKLDTVEGLSPSPTVSHRTNLPSKKPASAVTLVRPEKIGNRNRITTGEYATKAAKAEENLKSSLKPGASLVVAYYGTTDRKVDQIYIVASTIPGPLKKSTFDKQFENTGPSIDGQPTTNIVDIPVGVLGGFIKCGQTTQAGMDVAVCGFSNEYDYAVVQWYNRTLNDSIKKEIVTIRALLEK